MIVPCAWSLLVSAKTAGTNSPMSARTSSAAFEPAILGLNVWVPWRRPPTRTLAPITSSRFPMIEPVSEAFTTSISPACSAKNAMISSAILPNVAFRMPPTCGPVSEPSRSVDKPTTQARPRMAIAETTKSSVGSAWRPKSSTIAARLRTTVARSTTRLSGVRAPRIGSPSVRRDSVIATCYRRPSTS